MMRLIAWLLSWRARPLFGRGSWYEERTLRGLADDCAAVERGELGRKPRLGRQE